MDKKLMLAYLYDIYGSLLGEKHRDAFEMYYCEDLSLSEVAEHLDITRQGVRDKLRHAGEELIRLEDALHLFEKYGEIKKLVEEIKGVSGEDNGDVSTLCDKVISLIDN